MKTATRLDDLQVLGSYLQDRLHAELPNNARFQIKCALKDGALMVMAQHPAAVRPDTQQTFGVLEQAILAEDPELNLPIQLYLRVDGEKRPYSFHKFVVDARDKEASDKQQQTVKESLHNPFNWGQTSETHSSSADVENEEETEDEQDEVATEADSWNEPIAESAMYPDEEQEEVSATAKNQPRRPDLASAVVFGGISMFVFLGSFYALTRPCVIGSCKEISDAQQLKQESTQTLTFPASGQAILQAQEQLREAIAGLETIPFWSIRHKEAQDLLKIYRVQEEKLVDVVAALQKASRAADKSQNPPHSVSEWTEIQKLWREAIATLEQIPTNSSLRPLANQKLTAYRANLAVINKRLAAEKQSSQQLEAGKQASRVAEARMGVAQSLENWQLVDASWQTALNRLDKIPPATSAYEEAQLLMRVNKGKLSVVRDRKVQEQFSANTYKQGLLLAQNAKNSGAINQWSQSVYNWRNAIQTLKQVPNGTFYYSKAQQQISIYTQALNQAQVKLQLASIVQKANSDLKQTCDGKPPICNYTISNNTIKVRLTPTYAQKVRNAAIAAKMKGDYNAQVGIVRHVLTLGEALEAISDNVRIPLEVYGPDGAAIQKHAP